MTNLLRQVDVPEGQSGSWRVERFTISKEEAKRYNITCILATAGAGYRPVDPGTYTRLGGPGGLWMSDTPAELRDHVPFIFKAQGQVLITGLGLGVAVQAACDKPEVTHVTVLELEPDVIRLVAPHYLGRYPGRLEILQADALTWKPPHRYDVVWHDIWQDISGDNYETMKRLHRRYGRYAAWQESWCRWQVRRLVRG